MVKHIAVFDDHPIIKLSLEAMLSELSEKFHFHDIASSRELIKLVNKRELDILIFDVNYPGEDTLKLLTDCLMIYPHLKVLVFSSNVDVVYGKRFIKMGAKGYVNKGSNKDEILKAIQTVLAGELYLSNKLKEALTDQVIFNKPDNIFNSLTAREFEICMHILKGLSSSEIATIMGIQLPTIATHKHRIFEKLGVKNLIELYELYQVNQ